MEAVAITKTTHDDWVYVPGRPEIKQRPHTQQPARMAAATTTQEQQTPKWKLLLLLLQ